MNDNDVQNHELHNSFKLTKVGITGVQKPVTVERPDKSIQLVCSFEVSVDLPSTQKGSHMSRNVETINEVIDRSVVKPCSSMEGLSNFVAERLLEVHPYAGCSSVNIEAPYFIERTFMGKRSLERYNINARSTAIKNQATITELGVTVYGMTVCPCAMENVRATLNLPEGEGTPPVISHNQRNVVNLFIQVPEGHNVEAEDLIDIVEASQSTPTFEYLKRDAEAKIVIDAHNNPKFVEDVVRGILARIVTKYDTLPDTTSIHVRSTSQESIHKHDAFAERTTTLGELRE